MPDGKTVCILLLIIAFHISLGGQRLYTLEVQQDSYVVRICWAKILFLPSTSVQLIRDSVVIY